MDETLKFYRNRWRLVEEIEILEQRSATITERWQQLNAVFGLAKSLGILPSSNPEEEETIRLRWEKLRGKM